jgi:AcrR family transcriptional regulator
MGKPQPDKRTRLIETAMKLAYRNGFRETSLADIAEAARVPVGNVYYYFKTKEELGEARCGAAPGAISRIPGEDGPVEFSEGAAVCFCGEHS